MEKKMGWVEGGGEASNRCGDPGEARIRKFKHAAKTNCFRFSVSQIDRLIAAITWNAVMEMGKNSAG